MYTITLEKSHFQKHPQLIHLVGEQVTVRLIRTIGTSKLRSRILLTTLLDEKKYKWFDLVRLYLQRWKIELAFRHLKVNLRIEHIRKVSLHRIKQLLWGCVMIFNLSGMIRNGLKRCSLFPERQKTKMYFMAIRTLR